EPLSSFALAPEPTGPEHSPLGERVHLLDVNGAVLDGRLQITWVYSRNLHRQETIDRLADDFAVCLEALIDHCLSPDAGADTPADFPLAELDAEELGNLSQLIEAIDEEEDD
ncbi:MAG: hypothetical protein IAE79_22095, partial [Anaerolinea sp.]|nr:hypothetical protein [Anaerolinea sp.]